MANEINICGLSKAAVLVALYNSSKQQGLGFLDLRGALPMTEEQAQQEVNRTLHFDYLYGRVMKVSLDSDQLCPRLYDRDNGHGAAQRAIDAIRSSVPA